MTETPQVPVAPTPPVGGAPASNGLAKAGMILGIISAATCWMWCAPYVPIGCGVVGLILSIVGKGKAKQLGGEGAKQAKTGMILSIIGIVIPLIVWILIIAFFTTAAVSFNEELQRAAQQYQNMP